MCISPSYIWIERGPKWEKLPVPCKTCWRCKQNRLNNYVGRCLAEADYSQHVCAITLTYAPRDDFADKVLEPKHFQLFIKLLRRAGHKIRYLVAGEYGELKGRAHFHAILFFSHIAPPSDLQAMQVREARQMYEGDQGAIYYNRNHIADHETSFRLSRQMPSGVNLHIREWPHGHVFLDWRASEKAIRYCCKYLLKNDRNNVWFSCSKKPALGAAFFAAKAAQAKSLNALPASWNYLPPSGDKKRPYYLTGASRRDYLNAITTNEADRPRMSEWTAKSFDKFGKARREAEFYALPPEIQEAAYIAREFDPYLEVSVALPADHVHGPSYYERGLNELKAAHSDGDLPVHSWILSYGQKEQETRERAGRAREQAVVDAQRSREGGSPAEG